MRIPHIASSRVASCFEAVCAIRISSLLISDLLKEYHYGLADERSTISFSKLNTRHLQNAREMLLTALATIDDTTFEIRISVVPDLLHKAQGDIDMFLLIRCQAGTKDESKEKAVTSFLALFPVLATCLPEADLKLVISETELAECLAPFPLSHADAVIRSSQEIPVATLLNSTIAGFFCENVQKQGGLPVTIAHRAPWVPSNDDWGRLLEILAGQLEPTMLVIRLRSCRNLAEERTRLSALIELCENTQADAEANQRSLRSTVSRLEEQSSRRLGELCYPCFDVAAFITSGKPIPVTLSAAFGSAISGQNLGKDGNAWLQGGYAIISLHVKQCMEAGYFPEDVPFSLTEAACAFRFPSPPHRDIPGLPVQRFRANLAMLPPELDESPESIRLFLNEFQGMSQPVHIDPDDRMRHTYIMGQTGTGKSSLLENMILQDITAGRGVAVLDPHGDMIDNILKRIPDNRIEDVILFDLLDRECPIGFNILQWTTITERDLIIDSLYQHMDHMYNMRTTGGPMFEAYFRGTLKLLMGDAPRPEFTPTILEFKRCFTDRDFRRWLLKSISDQQIKDFITEAEDAGGECALANMAPYVSSKLSRFINDASLQRIVGQEQISFQFDDVLSQGKIFLVRLGKGRFGFEVSALVANMLISRIQLAAMKRGDLPEHERRDFFLYVDEAHNIPGQIVSQLLSEARKYRLGLILATQYCSQLKTDSKGKDDLMAAIFGNVGSLVTFRAGNQDAEVLSKGFAPYFNTLDIMSLPNYYGYARMNLKSQSMTPFSFRTELNDLTENEAQSHRIRTLSQLKYGHDVRIVDAIINRRITGWKNQSCLKGRMNWAPIVVNLIVLEFSYLKLNAMSDTCSLLTNANLITIGDIVRCSDTQLIEDHGFSVDDLRDLEECLNNMGCCLQEGGPFAKKNVVDDVE